MTDIDREELRVPDRFEALESEDPDTVRVVVVPVEASLSVVDERFRDMAMAGWALVVIRRGSVDSRHY